MELFKVIPDNFFSLLSSPNKACYAGAILEAFKVYEDASILGIDKKIVVEVLCDYLENEYFNTDNEDIEQEEGKEISIKEKANYILRRMEECGWIDIDVTNDYVELLNFRDYAISVCEALLQIEPTYSDYSDSTSPEYRGYIYTIYSLITNPLNIEYGVLMEQIYRNTKMFIRQLRKLDSRLKDYIKQIIDHSDIKELMDLLMDYKVELVDRAYFRLKTSDNVNKYRLGIVNKLDSFLMDNAIMHQIALSYQNRYHDYDEAFRRASRDINEIIEIFNSLDEMITEIDKKNKTYINSTIGKIEFLLKEDNNISGKLNTILKYISDQNKKGKVDSAITMVQPIFRLKSFKALSMDSLYQPRGSYQKVDNYTLLDEKIDLSKIQADFFKQYETIYTEENVLRFLKEHLEEGKVLASNLLSDDPTFEEVLMVIYALIYSNGSIDETYKLTKLDNIVTKGRFRFNDFMILREES